MINISTQIQVRNGSDALLASVGACMCQTRGRDYYVFPVTENHFLTMTMMIGPSPEKKLGTETETNVARRFEQAANGLACVK